MPQRLLDISTAVNNFFTNNIYIYDSDIVLNIVIPPLVTSCKILLIIVNFLAALAEV